MMSQTRLHKPGVGDDVKPSPVYPGNTAMPRAPRLFGSDVRMRYLLSLVCDGPTYEANLAARIGVHRSHVRQVTRHFADLGIICQPSGVRFEPVLFNRSSSELNELLALLRSIAGSVARTPIARLGIDDVPRLACEYDWFFGTPDRTKVLAIIDALGAVTISDVATLGGLNAGSVRAVVAHFANEKILRCTRIPPHVWVEFDAQSDFVPSLRRLVQRVALRLDLRDLANYQMLKSHSKKRERSRASANPVQHVPIGTRTQAEILVGLSRAPAMRVSDLAIMLNMTQDSVRGVAESLVRAGFVVRESRKGGRNLERWLSLNVLHPLYGALHPLLSEVATLGRLTPSHRAALNRATHKRVPGTVVAKMALVGSDRALDVLRCVASSHNCAVEQVAAAIVLPLRRVRVHVRALLQVGMICETGARKLLSLNPTYRFARHLRRFLSALDSQNT